MTQQPSSASCLLLVTTCRALPAQAGHPLVGTCCCAPAPGARMLAGLQAAHKAVQAPALDPLFTPPRSGHTSRQCRRLSMAHHPTFRQRPLVVQQQLVHLPHPDALRRVEVQAPLAGLRVGGNAGQHRAAAVALLLAAACAAGEWGRASRGQASDANQLKAARLAGEARACGAHQQEHGIKNTAPSSHCCAPGSSPEREEPHSRTGSTADQRRSCTGRT